MADRRQLTDAEKEAVIARCGMRCFINDHPIESEADLEFDHIKPVAEGGRTTLDNMAPVCKKHNRQKGKMSLSEYRDYLKLSAFFDDGTLKYLDDVIAAVGGQSGQRLQYEVEEGKKTVTLYFDGGKQPFSLYTCPATRWHYFYALIPVQYLKNDRDLQPRSLRQQSMWGLYRHFQRNTQLAPSICRFDEAGALMLFDGQHKAAAQVWAGRDAVECKVYIKPVAKVLKETNLEAHESYRQMSFYSYELMGKFADIFKEDWESYIALPGTKSEAGFVEYLINEKKMSAAKARSEVAKAIHWEIINHPDNKLADFISEKTRARNRALTYARLEKTLFRQLLAPIPTSVEFQSDDDFRDTEEKNMVRLMTIIAEEALIERWNPELNNALHQRTQRIFSAGSVRAWVTVLRDVLFAYLQLFLRGQSEINRVLYRELTDEQFAWIRKFVRQIFTHSVWDISSQEVSKRLTKDDDITALSVLKENGLDVAWVVQSASTM